METPPCLNCRKSKSRGVASHRTSKVAAVANVVIRHAKLRWPVPKNLPKLLRDKTIHALRRCGKYLLVEFDHGTPILHLGMSGSLRDFVDAAGQPGQFQQYYWVYGRGGELCRKCGALVKQIRQGQRSSFYCGNCQE